MSELELSPTVYGIETEYSCMITLPDDVVHEIVGECHSQDVALGLYQAPEKKGSQVISTEKLRFVFDSLGMVRTNGGMLSNGGRFYIDPSGPEYATPETRTAEEAVHRSFDGDYILLNVLNGLRTRGILQDFQINRRVVDHNRVSRGIHLNTTTALAPEPSRKVNRALACLNVVKGAMFGSGGLLVNQRGETEYHHSPRLSVTKNVSAHYHHYAHRPLVRVPFKTEGQLARVETVTSDALNFAWPLRASLVVTNAAMKMMELDREALFPRLANAVNAAQIVGQYGHEGIITETNYGKERPETAISILRRICEQVLETDDKIGFLDKESGQVLHEVVTVADTIEDDPLAVATIVESIARKLTIEQAMEKHNVAIDSERICRVDYAWDWIGGSGIAERLRTKNMAGWHGFARKYSPADVKRRITKPPRDTRAKHRAEAVIANPNSTHTEWQTIDTPNGKQYVSPYGELGLIVQGGSKVTSTRR